MKIIFMWMFGQFPKINSWLNWQSIDTRGQVWGEVNEIRIPCASSNYSQINFRMGKHGVKKPSISSDRRTNTGRSSKNVSTKFFLFSFFPLSMYTTSEQQKQKSILQKSSALYTHNKLEALSLFPWTQFLPPNETKISKFSGKKSFLVLFHLFSTKPWQIN